MYQFKLITKKIDLIKAVSLIELIMSMVIISIVFAVLVMSFQISIKVPAKKNIKLASEIAANYLNEIVSKNFPSNLPCPNAPPSNISRANYTEICNYNNLVDFGAKDKLGNQLNDLEKFNVYIKIFTSNEISLGNLSGSNNLANADIARIDVIVTNPNIPDLIISTYKGKY